MRRNAVWKPFMLAASYFFYGYWDWRFLGLIGASTILNHLCAVGIHRSQNRTTRRGLLTFAVLFNFLTLGFFKYCNFFIDSVNHLSLWLGIGHYLPLLNIILPVGISFFTFQAMTYVVDVYRKELDPAEHMIDFAVYLAFFPQLVAGPIVRAKVLLPQVCSPRSFRNIDTGRAAFLILGGLFKKIVIANYLAAHIVDPVFSYPDNYAGLDVLFAVYGYAIQIYCDFSAYSDIAIGVGLLLGFHIPINFNAPYLASSIQQFWRRWHISLSTWLRDYLYIPLGGSRHSSLRTYVNLMITFLLGGLWHGAGWTFIAWGALHGIYLISGRLLNGLMPRREPSSRIMGGLAHILKSLVVIHLVCLSWLFFRSQTFADAWTMVVHTGIWTTPTLITLPVLAAIVVGFYPVLQGALAAGILIVILALGPTGVAPFIYFQF